jgi:tetratricopeptide (TPR) repeat protein
MAPANTKSDLFPHPAAGQIRSPDPAAHSPITGSRRAIVVISILLAAIVWAVFGRTVHHAFVNFDDDVYVYKNPKVAGGLNSRSIVWAFTHVHSSNWHPLTWLSHMLDCQVYGLKPGGHHFTNILLHTATVILLFLLLREMTSVRRGVEPSLPPSTALWCSAFVAAVFAIHPLRVESVAWVAERKDLLSGLFFVLTLMAYVKGNPKSELASEQPRLSGFRFRISFGFLTLLFFALALMSKPMVVTLPFVLLLLDYWPLERFPASGERQIPWPLLVEKIPLFALSGAICLTTLFAQKEAMSSLSLPTRIGNALVSYVVYLKQMFYPANLAVFYPYPDGGVDKSKIVMAILLLLTVSIVVVVFRRTRPWLLVGWLWYLGTLVPAIGILQVGSQSQADRYTYLPQIGLYFALTWTVADLCARRRRWRFVAGGLGVAILCALIFCARAQTAYWRNSESLWAHALDCTSGSLTAHINLGNALAESGRTDEAMVHYQKALQLRPDDVEAHVSFGYILIQKGKLDEALAQLQTALELKPNHAEAHNDLGKLFAQQGKLDDAILQFQKALESRSDYAEARYNLGNALFQKGAMDEAIVQYEKALQTRPGYVEACFNLGNALFQSGKVDDAIARYQEALRIKPDYAKAAYNLATALIQKGKTDDAIAQFEKVLEIDPDQAEARYNLGSALLRKGKPDQAIAQFQAAVRIRPDFLEARNDLAWELATCPDATLRNGSEAVELAERANQIAGGNDPDVLDTLAAAYAEVGRFDDAIRMNQKAIELARAAAQPDRVAQLNSESMLYQSGQPFHQSGR